MADIEIGETPVRDIEETDKIIARDDSGDIVRINATSLSSVDVLSSVTGETTIDNIDVITSVGTVNGANTSIPSNLEAITVVGDDVFAIADNQKLLRYSSNPDDSLNYVSEADTSLGAIDKGLTYNFTTSEMYVSEGETVYLIDINTGVLTSFITDPIGGEGIGDICWYNDELHILSNESNTVVVYNPATNIKTREYSIGLTGSDRSPSFGVSQPRSFWIGDEGAMLAATATQDVTSSNLFLFSGEFESIISYTLLYGSTSDFNIATALAPSGNWAYRNLFSSLYTREITTSTMSKLSNTDIGLLAEPDDELIIDGSNTTVHRVIDADASIVNSVLTEPSVGSEIERVVKNGDKLEVVDASRVLLAFRTP